LIEPDPQFSIQLAIHGAYIEAGIAHVRAVGKDTELAGIKLQRDCAVPGQIARYVQRCPGKSCRRFQQNARIADLDRRRRSASAARLDEAFEAAEAKSFTIECAAK
jgi:hypothetical protein